MKHLITYFMLVSLIMTSAIGDTCLALQNKMTFCLAPWHSSQAVRADSPLTIQFLEKNLSDTDSNKRALALYLLEKERSQKRPWWKLEHNLIKPILVAVAAALYSALSVMGQEVVLKKIHFLHYLPLQPILATIVFAAWLKNIVQKDFFKYLFSFFPTLFKTKNILLYLSGWFAYQVIRNGIFFFILPNISSTGGQVIAASQLLFTPFLEFIMLGTNKFKWHYLLGFTLIAIGMVGYGAALPSIYFTLVGGIAFLAAAYESVARKKLINIIGAEAKTEKFTLLLLTWNYFLSFIFWTGMLGITIFSGLSEQFAFLKGSHLSDFFSSVFHPTVIISLFFTIFMIVKARAGEQTARTYKELPVSILEALHQVKIIFTAVIISALVLFSVPFGFSLPAKFVVPLISQWLFIAILLCGVLWLSYFQYKNEKKAAPLKLKDQFITLTDWDQILKLMENHTEWTASQAWENHFKPMQQGPYRNERAPFGDIIFPIAA